MINQPILSFIAGISISAVAGYLGTLMLSKKMSVTAGPLGHLAFPGVALAILYDLNISLGAFPFIILGIVLIWLLEIRTKLPTETLAAIIFTFGVGASLLFLPIEKAEAALVGNIWEINAPMTLVTIILSLIVYFVIRQTYHKMMLANIYEDLAKTEGINIKLNNLFYLGSIAVVVALGVTLVGGLLTVAIVAIPAATARNFSTRMGLYKSLAIISGILSTTTGLLISQVTEWPAGPMIILVGIFLFFISVLFKQRNSS
jgi:zinc transport system permease protein